MRVHLINPPDELEAMLGVGTSFIQRFEPLGLLYIAAALRERGHDVVVTDAYAEALKERDILARVEAVGADVVGFSTLTCNGALVWSLGQQIKARWPGVRIVLGNVHADVFGRHYLEHGCADAVIHGEGEIAMGDLLEAWEAGGPLDAVEGLSYVDARGKVRRTSPIALIKDLSALPWPARDLVDQRRYGLSDISNQNYIPRPGQRAGTLVTSRGCPFRCSFCVVHGNRKPRFNSAERVVDEMEMLEHEMGIGYVYIQDPLFMANRKRAEAICAEYRRRRLTLKWGCDAHVALINPEIIETFASAGCYELSLGIESGVPRILKSVRKEVTPDKTRRACEVIKRHSDIRVEGLFILGLPTETRAESLETIRFAKSLPIDMAQFSVFCPYPGSPEFGGMVARGELDTGVRDDGSVDPTVWRRYSSYLMFTDNPPIYVPEGRTIEELRTLQKRALREFYLRPRQIWQQLKRVRPSNVRKMAEIAFKGFF